MIFTPRQPDRPHDLNLPLIPPRYSIVPWLGLRKIISSAYLPEPEVLERYRGRCPHYVGPLDFTLAARDVQESRIPAGPSFVLLALLGSSTSALGFKAQLYDSRREKALSDRPLNFGNCWGSGKNPFFLKEPYEFAEDANILVKVQNQDIITNTVEVVLYGLWDETSVLHQDIRQRTGWAHLDAEEAA